MIQRFADEYKNAKIGTPNSKCEPKTVRTIRTNDSGIAVETDTEMTAVTTKGNKATKKIAIDDELQKTTEVVYFEVDGSRLAFKDCGLTKYRCAEMTVLAMSILGHKPKRCGFIGTGMTNLANCIAINKEFGVEDIVLRGSPRNPLKNVGHFMTVCHNVSVDTSDDMRMLNECDVVVICTSTCNPHERISADKLEGPQLIIALDCGFYLDESFREVRISYTDYIDQLKAHYTEEFPYDKAEHEFIQLDHHKGKCQRAVVYLYGIATADAVAAEQLYERLKEDGMEKSFLM